MIAALRKMADDAAQSAFRARLDYHSRHGVWNPQLTREYRRLQMLVEMIDEHIVLTQAEDLDAPVDTFDPAEGHSFDPAPDVRRPADPGNHYVGMPS